MIINKGTIALGVLFAPDKGSNTRAYIKDESLNVVDVIKKDASVLKEDLKASAKACKAKFNEEFGIAANKASHKADSLIDLLEKGLGILKEKNKKFKNS